MRIDNAMAGVAGLTQKPVPPGGSFEYRFTPPDSGFYWYHPHVHPFSNEQLARGLYGIVIVDETGAPKIDREMLVVLEDWKLDEKGAINADFHDPTEIMGLGRIGTLLTVNSKPIPATEILPPLSRVRLRLLSAVNARIMLLSFLGVRPLILAIDGQPCDAFEPVRRTLPVGPGARFDVIFDLPQAESAEASLVLRGENGQDRALLTFTTRGEQRAELPQIGSLEPNPLLPAAIKLQDSRKIDIVLEGGAKTKDARVAPSADTKHVWKLNGIAADGFGPTPLFSVKRGTAVTIGFINKTAFVQQMHVQGHHMRLLHDLDDGWEPYWRDAVLVPEGKTKHVAFVADNPGKWAIECLMAERQVTGMITWFEVT
jgi:FtsP/CotA-like multicopper oxidase with cupredoxin domain